MRRNKAGLVFAVGLNVGNPVGITDLPGSERGKEIR